MPADLDDRADFDDARRGLIARLEPGVITAADGRVVWNIDEFADAVAGECPETANPSLWRQAQLTAIQGLFEVTSGIYQVRGADLANITFVESDHGVIVIDPLISAECAAAAIALYRAHRGQRPVSAVIYTHAHLDHFGGVLGVVDADTDVPILAPAHFMEHAVSENVYAGVAMLRRGMYYGGGVLGIGAEASLGMGLGPRGSRGTTGLLAPTTDITETGQEVVLDGVRIVFQLTPDTESPAEMNFFFPDHRALCLAENVTHNMHNLLTLRGAQVRDSRLWSRYIGEAMELFLDSTEVAFASHHWPTWGRARVEALLTTQRDLYGYVHDQTLRLMNQGMTGSEIAEVLEVPDGIDSAWHTHGYYGSLSHGVKAIYQRYLGWYDGNPAHLWQHPPTQAAIRYSRMVGGPEQLAERAREFYDEGDWRFAAELASHAVFADPDSASGRAVLADALTSMAYGAENATWRNCFLIGAKELRDGITPTALSAGGMRSALSVTQLFDTVAIRLDGPRAAALPPIRILWHVADDGTYLMELSNGVLSHRPTLRSHTADLTVTLTKAELLHALGSGALEHVDAEGDTSIFTTLLDLTDSPDPNFAIVTP